MPSFDWVTGFRKLSVHHNTQVCHISVISRESSHLLLELVQICKALCSSSASLIFVFHCNYGSTRESLGLCGISTGSIARPHTTRIWLRIQERSSKDNSNWWLEENYNSLRINIVQRQYFLVNYNYMSLRTTRHSWDTTHHNPPLVPIPYTPTLIWRHPL